MKGFVKYSIVCVFTGVGLSLFFAYATTETNSYSDLDTAQMIKINGYPAETHEVVTDDGYILTMHRIPFSPKSPKALNQPVVLMLHGILANSADYVVLGPQRSEAYHHSDNGYDVWLANLRGSTYSRRHKKLSSWSNEFWNFSYHEMGIYDAPALIDYILYSTKQENLYISGLSMGSTVFFIMASTRPEYNDKVRLMVAQAPVTKIHVNWNSLLTQPPTVEFFKLMYRLGVSTLLPSDGMFKTLANTVCSNRVTRIVCSMIIYAFAGYDPGNLEMDDLPVIFSHLSGWACVKSLKHSTQIYEADKFQLFDYGDRNMDVYNQVTPPEYNLTAVTTPVAIFYGPNDPVGQPDNVIWLDKAIGNSVKLYKVPSDTFTHFGFVYGQNAKTLIFDMVSSLFLLY